MGRLCYLDGQAGSVSLAFNVTTFAMKTPSFPHLGGRSAAARSGFTLIELLVVIAIIIVLAGAGFSAGNFAINKAKRTKALAVCVELEQAIQRFYDDNGTLPVEISSDQTVTSNSAEGLDMLLVLMNQETTDPPLNSKGIKYLNIKEGKNDTDGLMWNEAGNRVEGLYDPWGGDYSISLDGDFDEAVPVAPKAEASARVLQRRVAVWSNGADGSEGSAVGTVKDDVKTW